MATSGGMASPKILSSEQVELNKIAWHSLSREEVLQTLQSRTDGLTEREVKKRHSIYGYNEIIEGKKRSTAVIFAKQLTAPLIMILVATVISAVIDELINAIVIIAIVILAAVFGFVQEY